MTFYETLDSIMKQDFGGRGLLASLPASPLAAVSASLAHAKRSVLLTGFPVRMPDGSITGETDGPSRSALHKHELYLHIYESVPEMPVPPPGRRFVFL